MRTIKRCWAVVIAIILLMVGCTHEQTSHTTSEKDDNTMINVFEAAAYVQALGDSAGIVDIDATHRQFVIEYDLYIQEINIDEYASVADVYGDEEQVLFTYLARQTSNVLSTDTGWETYEDFDANNFSCWSVVNLKIFEPDLVQERWPYIDLSDIEIDPLSEYLLYSVNRKIKQLSIYPGHFGDAHIQAESYAFGTPEKSPENRQDKSHNGLIGRFPPDSLRCILESDYYPNTIFVYKIGHNVQPFNMISSQNHIYWEYTQVEI